MGMNTSKARVIDPVLTQHAIGYRDSNFIGLSVLKRVGVGQRGGQVLRFGKEAFKLHNTRRAPGANVPRLQVGFGTERFSLKQDSLAALVPWETQEEAQNGAAGVDLAQRSVEAVLSSIQRGQEKEIADLVRSEQSYAQGHTINLAAQGNKKWSDPDSNPIELLADVRSTIRRKIGTEPNTLVLGYSVAEKLQRHAGLIELVKYSQVGILDMALLKRLLQVDNIIVGKATYAEDTEDEGFVDIWGNDAQYLFLDNTPAYETPSFGYTYTLNGNPTVEVPYEDKAARSDVYTVTHEAQSVITMPEAGFLIKNAV